MAQIIVVQAPNDVSAETALFLEVLQVDINTALEKTQRYVPRSSLPDNVGIGTLVYYTGDGELLLEGLYLFKQTGWEFVA